MLEGVRVCARGNFLNLFAYNTDECSFGGSRVDTRRIKLVIQTLGLLVENEVLSEEWYIWRGIGVS